jgi:hypothetical protein
MSGRPDIEHLQELVVQLAEVRIRFRDTLISIFRLGITFDPCSTMGHFTPVLWDRITLRQQRGSISVPLSHA